MASRVYLPCCVGGGVGIGRKEASRVGSASAGRCGLRACLLLSWSHGKLGLVAEIVWYGTGVEDFVSKAWSKNLRACARSLVLCKAEAATLNCYSWHDGRQWQSGCREGQAGFSVNVMVFVIVEARVTHIPCVQS